MPSLQQRKKLRNALIDAFPNKSSLEQLLYFELGRNLNEITRDSDLQDIVFKLIQTAESGEWLEDLVRAARNSNPRNSRLQAIAQEVLRPSPSPDVAETNNFDLDIQNAAALYKEILQKESDFLAKKIEQLRNIIQQLKSYGLQDNQLEPLIDIIQELAAKKKELDQQTGADLDEVITLFTMDTTSPAKKAAEYLEDSLKSS